MGALGVVVDLRNLSLTSKVVLPDDVFFDSPGTEIDMILAPHYFSKCV